jgi:hypothetical protein
MGPAAAQVEHCIYQKVCTVFACRDNESQKLLKDVCKLAGRDAGDCTSGLGQLDLSDHTFTGLKRKLKELADLKV